MEQSVAQILQRTVEGCLSLETSLGKNSGISIYILKKGSNNNFLPIRNEY